MARPAASPGAHRAGLSRLNRINPTQRRNPPMPTIRVEMFEGRTVEQKRALAQALTEATVRTLGGSAEAVDILFYDIARQDWATGGKLWSDTAPAKPAGS
ncbi:4-oxalocrotonate tautomerase [Variovorax dokdonensis]|uniref:4-oxalocrotonate tautomerase n=2 Tax=Variovorax dokdonensis TaxID=344883 RepID=A0ABT7NGG2_9BURK|nr:4-oxalocrotonate tautomerase [Variovorax dokdonensis]MDM0047041.1 4-oxalocrotonate tautomerase [Variovorax dokdonensis]